MATSAQTSYPRTVEEMLEQGWYDKILSKVKKYNLNDILNTPEEIVQDIFMDLLKSRYLERYDPEKRNFEVYIYVFVTNSVKKRGIREGSKNGRNIVNHNSLEYTQDEDGASVTGVTFLDRIDTLVTEDQYSDIVIQDLIERTRASLQAFKASSSFIYEGVEYQRDPLTVFNLLLEEKSVPEIAEILGTSKQFIYNLLQRIRSTKEMQEFHMEMERSNSISDRGKRRPRVFTV